MLLRRLTDAVLKRQQFLHIRNVVPQLYRGQHTAEHDDSDALEFRELVREFAQRVVAPHAADIDTTNAFPQSVNLWTELGQMGLHGMFHLHSFLNVSAASIRFWKVSYFISRTLESLWL